MAEPARALAHPSMGRLYAIPGTTVPGWAADALRERSVGEDPADPREARRAVQWADGSLAEGLLVPSVTNIIGVRDKPHLVPWSGRLAVEAAFDFCEKWPDLVKKDRRRAVRYCKQASDRDRDAAADHGTTVHEAAEAVALGLPRPDGMNERHLAYFASWEAWREMYKPEWYAVEATCYSSEYGYMGTADFIAYFDGELVVGDYKTSRSLHEEICLQLAAIKACDVIVDADGTTRPMPQVAGRGMAVHLGADGFSARESRIDEPLLRSFVGLRAAWNFHMSGGQVEGESALGKVFRTASMGRPAAAVPA